MGMSLSCVVQVHRIDNPNESYRRVIVFDGFIISSNGLEEGARFNVIGRMKRILDPPAINFQLPFVAADFSSGVRGLAVWGEVFAKTGNPAPGLPDETILSFTPPVTNSGHPPLIPFNSPPKGVVSTVQLSGGRMALWVGIYTS